MPNSELKTLLVNNCTEFWDRLAIRTGEVLDFDELFALSLLRRKAHARNVQRGGGALPRIRLALVGGYSLYPLYELLEHLLETEGIPCDLWKGDYDNYTSEIMDDASGLYSFAPEVVLLMPSEYRCRYSGNLADSMETQRAEADVIVGSLLEMAEKLHRITSAEVIVTNFMLPARYDLGPYRSRTLGSDWSFRKFVNLELGFRAASYLHICDIEFLAYRNGGIKARDERAWYESKQPCSPELLVSLAHEVVHIIGSLRRAPKKVLVLDLDNTLWGGVIADDSLEGIEIGDTSPRGEAFKAFQKYILLLKGRGTLLAVCSKNDHAKAAEVFEKHPEMILRMQDFVGFKANWDPKSENIRQLAAELNLGLDSFAFVDDNPAEIEIVRQFVPEVATILLGKDPSDYVTQLQDCRLFEPRNITTEDVERTNQYRSESQRKGLLAAVTDMNSYLQSLEMEGTINEISPVDAPRLAQLINKSNQFNLTTRRRSEADIHGLIKKSDNVCFSVRLKDRFGDHGLISIVIAQIVGEVMHIDTWLMSCRVLKREVEEEVLNELVRLAKVRGCNNLHGVYLRTAKNEMVSDFYLKMGFRLLHDSTDTREFEFDITESQPIPTKIKILHRAYEPK